MTGHGDAVAPWFEEAWGTAEAAVDAPSRCWALGPDVVSLRTGSDAVADVVLAGLAPEPVVGGPGPTWIALDGRATRLPPPPFGPEDVQPRDGVRHASAGTVRLAWAIERRVLWGLDTATGRGLVWMRDPALAAPWDRSAPWRPLVSWWLPERGAVLVHAAAVAPPGRPDAGLLIVGPSGAGKSTLALAAGLAGWTVTGDDYVVVDASPGWRATAPYRWAKADAGTRALLGVPDAWLVPGVDHLGKALVDLPAALGPAGAAAVGLHRIVVPHRATATAASTPVSGATVLAAAGPSTVLQTPGDAGSVMARIAAIARAVPAVSLPVGPDVATAGAAALAEVAG